MNEERASHSLFKQYSYKLVAGGFGFAAGIISQLIVPRALGPTAYGNYCFVTSFFTQFIVLLDSGSSQAFYTFLSKRPNDTNLVRFYWSVSLLFGIAMLGTVGVVYAFDWSRTLWPDQTLTVIILALGLAWVQFAGRIVSSIIDARGLTVYGERTRLIISAISIGLLLSIFLIIGLNLYSYFAHGYLVQFVAIAIWLWLLARLHRPTIAEGEPRRWRSYASEMWLFTSPLILCNIYQLLVGIAERWLLQKAAGPIEQGFFGLSMQIGMVCFLFTSSLTPIVMREFAKDHASGDLARMKSIFMKSSTVLFFITTYFCIFVATHSTAVASLLFGKQFEDAGTALMIVALYPMHQTYGQLSGAVLLAMGKTRLMSAIGFAVTTVGLPLVYWLVASEAWGGLNLKAVGLSIKTVGIQLISVMLYIWFTSRCLGFSFVGNVLNQIVIVSVLAGISLGVSALVDLAFEESITRILISGFCYSVLTLATVLALPRIITTTRAEIIGTIRDRWPKRRPA